MTPAEELRAAATKLREMGSAATPGPWRRHDTWLDKGGFTATVLSDHDTAWIALMGPDKGMLLATLLDVCAYSQQVHAGCSGLANAMTPEQESALVVARAVLEEKS